MTNHSLFQKLTVVVLLVATIFVTTPVSAADFTTKAALGSISGAGSVELRGVSIDREGTVFAGDHVTVGSKSGAKILLASGQKIVLDQLTALTFAAGGQVQIGKGNVAFSSKSGKLDLVAGQYQIKGDRDLSGNVSFVGANYVGLRVTTGNAVVLNLKTHQTYKIGAGQERLFNAATGDVSAPMAQLALAALPDAIPAVPSIPQRPTPPQTPPQTPGQRPRGTSHSALIAILATAGGAAVAIALLSSRDPNKEEGRRVLDAATTAAANATTADSTIATNATTVQNLPGISPALAAQAQTIRDRIGATTTQIASLTSQLNTLKSQLDSAGNDKELAAVYTQINAVVASLNGQTLIINQQIAALNDVLAAARTAGVPNVPTVTITPLGTLAPIASSSIPT